VIADMTKVRRCTRCQRLKPLDAFYRWSGSKTGRMARCKACESVRVRAWRALNKSMLAADQTP
jgi:hypothetical protein